jgi:hypothetical protein
VIPPPDEKPNAVKNFLHQLWEKRLRRITNQDIQKEIEKKVNAKEQLIFGKAWRLMEGEGEAMMACGSFLPSLAILRHLDKKTFDAATEVWQTKMNSRDGRQEKTETIEKNKHISREPYYDHIDRALNELYISLRDHGAERQYAIKRAPDFGLAIHHIWADLRREIIIGGHLANASYNIQDLPTLQPQHELKLAFGRCGSLVGGLGNRRAVALGFKLQQQDASMLELHVNIAIRGSRAPFTSWGWPKFDGLIDWLGINLHFYKSTPAADSPLPSSLRISRGVHARFKGLWPPIVEEIKTVLKNVQVANGNLPVCLHFDVCGHSQGAAVALLMAQGQRSGMVLQIVLIVYLPWCG